ncbi:hypothetical protein [Streptacidiphilus sp. EB103A]|uniref:hypothetical protein n=1 Tax=Streptacidiphilus sp. EB103A TaxID=3156275 RepID=UPI0035134E95
MSDALCRRCGRPLSARLAVAAGVGSRCALLDLTEATAGPSRPSRDLGGATAEQTAIALVAAFLHHQDDQVMPLLLDTDLTDVAGLMAAIAALHLGDLPDGDQLLREAALRVAQAGT